MQYQREAHLLLDELLEEALGLNGGDITAVVAPNQNAALDVEQKQRGHSPHHLGALSSPATDLRRIRSCGRRRDLGASVKRPIQQRQMARHRTDSRLELRIEEERIISYQRFAGSNGMSEPKDDRRRRLTTEILNSIYHPNIVMLFYFEP